MENTTGYIYVLTAPNGKTYVGQTIRLNRRWQYYKSLHNSLKRQPHLYSALKKYGPENFDYTILDICYEKSELDDAEIYWIQYYNSIENGYNIKTGGTKGRGLTKQGRKKLSIKSKLYWKNMSPERKLELIDIVRKKNIGTKWSIKAKERISLSRMGRKTWNKGIPHTKDHIEKIKNGMNKEHVKEKIGWRKGISCTNEEIDIQRKSHRQYEYTMISPDGKTYKDTSVVRLVKTIFDDCGSIFKFATCRQSAASSKRGIIKGWKIYRKKI